MLYRYYSSNHYLQIKSKGYACGPAPYGEIEYRYYSPYNYPYSCDSKLLSKLFSKLTDEEIDNCVNVLPSESGLRVWSVSVEEIQGPNPMFILYNRIDMTKPDEGLEDDAPVISPSKGLPQPSLVKEVACSGCGRTNDVGALKCWWCETPCPGGSIT